MKIVQPPRQLFQCINTLKIWNFLIISNLDLQKHKIAASWLIDLDLRGQIIPFFFSPQAGAFYTIEDCYYISLWFMVKLSNHTVFSIKPSPTPTPWPLMVAVCGSLPFGVIPMERLFSVLFCLLKVSSKNCRGFPKALLLSQRQINSEKRKN